MKRVVLSSCGVVAVALAMSLGAVTTALAAPPEIGRCVKLAKAEGKFSSDTCTKEEKGTKVGKGPYEWEPGVLNEGKAGAKTKFTDTAGTATLETIHKAKVQCKENISEGEITSPKTVGHVSVKFTGCEFKALEKPCTSPGAKEGEIDTNTLAGTLVWENKAKKKVAQELYPEAGGPGAEFVTFVCGPGTSKVRGEILVNITAGKMESSFPLKFTAKTGKQKPDEYENEEGKKVPAFLEAKLTETYEQAGQTETVTQTNPEALEVNWFV